jgi:threonine dehydratase
VPSEEKIHYKMIKYPRISEINTAAETLSGRIWHTPAWQWPRERLQQRFGINADVIVKLEMLQHTGSFKPRAALLNTLQLDNSQLEKGITAVSAGNHAAAVAFAARQLGTSAKVVMPENADPYRIKLCRSFGAEVVQVADVHQCFEAVEQIKEEEGRSFIHPFEGWQVVLGTGTLGSEFYRQADSLDVAIIPIGGGGLCAGMSCAIKQHNPDCHVIGVEPVGADTMHRSFASGKPESIDAVNTIADSLGAPYAAEYSLSVCMEFVDELVLVDDPALCEAMAVLFNDMKLAVEPAAAAATAALAGPLRGRFENKRVGLICCGANISVEKFCSYVA